MQYNRILKTNKGVAPVKEIPFQPSTLETVDLAFYNWVKDMNIFATTNKGFKEVPIVWVGQSRAFHIKNNHKLRDAGGSFILPVITIARTSLAKRLDYKGTVYAGLDEVKDRKGGTITIARKIYQDKTANFANADSWRQFSEIGGPNQVNFPRHNEKIVYKTYTIPIPVYLDITYTIGLQTEYQQQMNEIITVISTITGGINYAILKHAGHRYEAFLQEEFAMDDNIESLGEDERKYIMNVPVRVLGYIIGAGKNQANPKIIERENAVEVKIPREKVVFGDIPDHIDERGFYR